MLSLLIYNIKKFHCKFTLILYNAELIINNYRTSTKINSNRLVKYQVNLSPLCEANLQDMLD